MVRIPIRNEWKGEKCFIVAGGPSLKNIDVNLLQGKGRVIAVNNSYKLCPFADWLVFSDDDWYEWHEENLSHIDMPIICGGKVSWCQPPKNVLHWEYNHKHGLAEYGHLTGMNSGHSALSLAEYMGCNPIILLGFDMKTDNQGNTQWHNEHKRPSNISMYENEFIPSFNKTAELLKKKNVSVYNVNFDSALRCFDFLEFEKTLDI